MRGYMQKVANMLGLELGEYFRLRGDRTVFYLSEDGLKSWSNEKQAGLPEILESILAGFYGIEKLDVVPSAGKQYFVPDPLSVNSIRTCTWSGCFTTIDGRLLGRNLVCKTEEEAQELVDIMLEAVKKHRDRKQCEKKDDAK